MLTEFVRVAEAKDVPDGEMRPYKVNNIDVLVANVAGTLYAIGNVCSHFHAYLTDGELRLDDLQVQCPLHDSCFDLRTGEPLDPPAEEPVETFAVKVEDDCIWIGPRS